MINAIMTRCDARYQTEAHCNSCEHCTYGQFCPHNCADCLDYIHTPTHAPLGAPQRNYDCRHMADYYVCKYTCRYVSEMIYAFRRLQSITNKEHIQVLSFGCGPCTDLMALDYLRNEGTFNFNTLQFLGVDYSQEVWQNVHNDINNQRPQGVDVHFYYQDVCDFIANLVQSRWIPDLVTFQYFFSDMQKHSQWQEISRFIREFSEFANNNMSSGSYIVLNDINLSIRYGGGREYFDELFNYLINCDNRLGRFRNDNPGRTAYRYGELSDGEFPSNNNLFDLRPWAYYSPYDTCASAQMLIKRR